MRKSKGWRITLYAILITYGLITLFPFAWAVSASFKTYAEIVGGGLNLIPQNPTLDNFRHILFGHNMFPRWIMNSFIIAGIGTIVNILLNSMAGYSLARLRFPGRGIIFYAILAAITIPGQILLIPNFLIMRSLGMLDTFGALIIPTAVNFTYIFMMRQFFVNFPREVEEAAKVDGLSSTMTFFRIVFPMARASIATQGIFVFMSFWNEFLRPLLYLASPQNFPITLGLRSFQDQNVSWWNYIMAGSLLSILPIIGLYIVLNKYFMTGFRIGGDK
ncbi:MAG: carbohydrate ABC transporter permease [Defluviitaleaceae bacterium]|nr:carbohydrate ABC transporter permease [Defluviitaleaceae bacterium]